MTESSFVDDPKAPEFFASFIKGAAFDAPNVRLTFASARVDHSITPGHVNTVANVRIVMSIPALRNMYEFLGKFLATAELNAAQKPPDQVMQ